MRIKLIVNGCEVPEDYQLLKTTISTVATLRKTAVLRFNSERLSIISTPKSTSNTSSTILHGDNGQLWCSIPRDVFRQYTVVSQRELNAITMECNCDSLLSAFKRYEKVIARGSSSEMVIKLQAMPELNLAVNAASGSNGNSGEAAKSNPVCALGISFEEILHTMGDEDKNGYSGSNGANAGAFGSKKTIMHSFKVPVRLMSRVQDVRIKEPMVSGAQLSMYKLPPYSSEFGAGFSNFIRRVDRYTSVNHIRLSAINKKDALGHETNRLKLVINELDWHLQVCWNGPLTPLVPEDMPPQASQDDGRRPISRRETAAEDTDDSMRIDESTVLDAAHHDVLNSLPENDVELMDVSAVVEQAERESAQTHEVMIKIKDWKVCHKLYDAFEELILAISHNESCVLHCSLDRGSVDEGEDPDKPREKGQIIYYMARSKPI
ncbi:ZYRO0D14674p [Zygosaccharomyces rouxii]|uniref:ZYRO0D14674p n=1 Tax=Zygosaccharomyces rouxii (strain ATCC 2623 / CBS 732 / NBRC 1130 / NCYC 568 / NRRL Y-229) TaxID=559307 RepID=C5DWG6_ZYGRC|nr:uncharacterized protein ZYRO0D14674g [Zygosaccharomyces rouxii]KAH9201046.1 checkpoint protein Hus1/Mec3 [Zygosaccharomyces rouxii]CAR28135.1 ZYRO0D14674p [Zygosaccharomyces rouxii]